MKRIFALLVALSLTFALTGWASAAGTDAPAEAQLPLLELPIEGASGYAATEMALYGPGDVGPIGRLAAGQGFTILQESGIWWQVLAGDTVGWVTHLYCLINLPDVLPSIVYNNTNAYASLFRSSGKEIPGVTGEALYQSIVHNYRFGRHGQPEYLVPVLYPTALKIAAAQRTAFAEGNTLVIYEAFRPANAHTKVYDSLGKLAATDKEVYAGMTGNTYTAGWFLAPAPYNHQRGTAIDVSLAKVERTESFLSGDYEYTHVGEYTEYPMQTAMHELSRASAIYTTTTSYILTPAVTEGSLLLQRYCVNAGLTPLASEWWHFNDLPSTTAATTVGITGWYSVTESHSVPPGANLGAGI